MRVRFVLCFALCFVIKSVCCAQETKPEKTFPTKEEIDLVVTQAERAFEQYKQSVDSEAGLPSAMKDNSGVEKDKQIVETAGQLISGLRKNPDVFYGLGGLLLLTTLDDASRNAALCGTSGMGDIGSELLQPKPNATLGYRLLSITQKCNDVSAHLYTVSESVSALLVRTVEAQSELNAKVMDTLNVCSAAMKNAKANK